MSENSIDSDTICDTQGHISSLTVSSGSEVGLWLNAHKKEIEAMANTSLAESGNMSDIVSYMNKESKRNKEYEEFFISDSQGNYTIYLTG